MDECARYNGHVILHGIFSGKVGHLHIVHLSESFTHLVLSFITDDCSMRNLMRDRKKQRVCFDVKNSKRIESKGHVGRRH